MHPFGIIDNNALTQPGAMSEWARLAKSGDPDALRRLAASMQGDLEQCVERCVKRNPALAPHREDVEAEVLLALKELAEAYDPAPTGEHATRDRWFGSFARTRLDRTLARRCQRFFSKDAQGGGVEEVFFSQLPATWEPLDPSDPIKRIEDRDAIEDALTHLGESEQQVIRLYYFEDMTQEQVASQLGLSVGTVGARLKAARERLRVYLEGAL
jgi:RNA polymerase sigma factor (sigma-70 family)